MTKKRKPKKAVTQTRSGRFATRKNQTKTERGLADRDQVIRELRNQLLVFQRDLEVEKARSERYLSAFEITGKAVIEQAQRSVTVMPPPIELQLRLNDLRRYSHEIGTVGSSERAMAAVNALCKWGQGPQVSVNDSGGAQGIPPDARRDMTQPFVAGTCAYNNDILKCSLDMEHDGPHLGPCGCSNGCKAWNCPNL